MIVSEEQRRLVEAIVRLLDQSPAPADVCFSACLKAGAVMLGMYFPAADIADFVAATPAFLTQEALEFRRLNPELIKTIEADRARSH